MWEYIWYYCLVCWVTYFVWGSRELNRKKRSKEELTTSEALTGIVGFLLFPILMVPSILFCVVWFLAWSLKKLYDWLP